MDHAASPLQHLRTLLKLVELLFAPILALAARGQVGALSRAAERALARLERGFCDYMRRELVKQGFAHAADLADAWFLARLHGKRPNSDDAVSPEPKKAKYRSSSPLREGGRAKGGGAACSALRSPITPTPNPVAHGGETARVRGPPQVQPKIANLIRFGSPQARPLALVAFLARFCVPSPTCAPKGHGGVNRF